jgi:hypothetical protein
MGLQRARLDRTFEGLYAMQDINLANLIYALGALVLVAFGYLQSRRAQAGANIPRLLGYIAIWAGLLFAVAFLYQTFAGRTI